VFLKNHLQETVIFYCFVHTQFEFKLEQAPVDEIEVTVIIEDYEDLQTEERKTIKLDRNMTTAEAMAKLASKVSHQNILNQITEEIRTL
jgi:hypothetical protein